MRRPGLDPARDPRTPAGIDTRVNQKRLEVMRKAAAKAPASVYYWPIVAHTDLDRAVGLLGPLEGRIMRAIWAGDVDQPFVVRSLQPVAPELAYTTLMTTLNRLAEKGLLVMQRVPHHRAHQYQAAGTPEQFLTEASRAQAAQMLARFGDAALVAFATRLDELSPQQRERLRKLVQDA